MNTARKLQIENDERLFIFKIIKGGSYYSGEKTKLVNDLWTICHSVFWPEENFSKTETERFKKLIEQHFIGCRYAEDRFVELVERIVMAKQYIDRRPWRYIAKPLDWLNINYRYGLSGTRSWYERVVTERSTKPQHNCSIRQVAEALLEHSKNQDITEVRACTEQLCDLREYALLRLYINAFLLISEKNNH